MDSTARALFSKSRVAAAFVTAFVVTNVNIQAVMNNIVPACANGSQVACIAVFFSSPFSAIEDYSSVTSVMAVNLVYNFGIVAALAFVAGLLSYKSHTERFITAGWAFVIMVVSTYVVSAVYWVGHGVPATGTYVIGFSLCLYIAVMAVYDVLVSVKSLTAGDNRVLLVRLTIVVIVVHYAVAVYIVGNQAVADHLIGGAMFVWVLVASAVYTSVRDRERRRNTAIVFQLDCFR